MSNNKILFSAIVTHTDDPLLLGRVRAEIDSDRNDAILKSIQDPPFDPSKELWGDRDPFVFKPLLPYYLSSPILKDERVLIIFANKDYKFDDQYYIQADFTSPMRLDFNSAIEARTATGSGRRFKVNLSLKNLDGSYRVKKTKGLFVEPQDTGLIGRGSSDIIIKEDDVLIRAGKYKGQVDPREFPNPNTNRSFVQVSQFNTRKITLPPVELEFQREKVLLTKFLIEWVIQNPESTSTYDGVVNLYSLKQNDRVSIDKLNVSVPVDDLKTIRARSSFNGLTKAKTIDFINNFIANCDNLLKLEDGTQLFFQNEIKYPIYFRPGYSTHLRLTPFFNETPPPNLIEIYSQIKFDPFSQQGGHGFIYSKGSTKVPTLDESSLLQQVKTVNEDNSATIIGADEIYFLSHKAEAIPNKFKVDLSNTIYGIEQDNIADNIQPNTSSMVRGEELLELINLIVRFLVTHAHPFPGLPPVSVTEDKSTINELLKELALANKKILNKKIRIN